MGYKESGAKGQNSREEGSDGRNFKGFEFDKNINHAESGFQRNNKNEIVPAHSIPNIRPVGSKKGANLLGCGQLADVGSEERNKANSEIRLTKMGLGDEQSPIQFVDGKKRQRTAGEMVLFNKKLMEDSIRNRLALQVRAKVISWNICGLGKPSIPAFCFLWKQN